ncbi:MAG: helicase-related protein [Candidatus Hydrothermarchaeaceae archaeon]
MYVAHPLIKESIIEARRYQEAITEKALMGNTLVVAPTALGKTVIAILLAAERLHRFPESSVVMLSTTRPLVNQHSTSFRRFLNLPEETINAFTGYTPPIEREELLRRSKVVCATPQVVKNDLANGRYTLANTSLLIFDEAHRCTGDYPYARIAREYVETSRWPLILGLTASPGSEISKIDAVKEHLYIENIEVRTERDPDVKPYVKGMKIEWKQVSLPDPMLRIKGLLNELLRDRLKSLRSMGVQIQPDPKVSKRDLLVLRQKTQEELSKGEVPLLYSVLSGVVACINLSHASELLETQGLETLVKYFERLRKQKTRAAKSLLKEARFIRAIRLAENFSSEIHHPKLDALVDIIRNEAGLDKRIIVFAHYRDSAERITTELDKLGGIKPVRFVGQASRESDRGLSQREQLEILDAFREGAYNVLVATSVAEEGLDIPKVDLVVFYEPVPSEIRSIQRRGRTGRARAGKVVVLMTKGTRDEGFYWSSFHKERRMRRILEELKGAAKTEIEQRALKDFSG